MRRSAPFESNHIFQKYIHCTTCTNPLKVIDDKAVVRKKGPCSHTDGFLLKPFLTLWYRSVMGKPALFGLHHDPPLQWLLKEAERNVFHCCEEMTGRHTAQLLRSTTTVWHLRLIFEPRLSYDHTVPGWITLCLSVVGLQTGTELWISRLDCWAGFSFQHDHNRRVNFSCTCTT